MPSVSGMSSGAWNSPERPKVNASPNSPSVAGAYRFRPTGKYNALDLNEYLEEVFASFGRWDRSQLRVSWQIQPRLQHIRQLIREAL